MLRYLIIYFAFCLFASNLMAQTNTSSYTVTVNTVYMGSASGSLSDELDEIISLANTDAAAGKQVTVYFNVTVVGATGNTLVQVTEQLPQVSPQMGSITFTKFSGATTDQGIEFAAQMGDPTIVSGFSIYNNSSSSIVHFDNLKIVGFVTNYVSGNLIERMGINIEKTNNVTIDYCSFINNTVSINSTFSLFNKNLVIDHNTFDVSYTVGVHGQTGIFIYYNLNTTYNAITLSNNTFTSSLAQAGGCIRVLSYTANITEYFISGNTFNNVGRGIDLNNFNPQPGIGSDITFNVVNNYFNNVSQGLLLYCPMKYWKIENNTFSDLALSTPHRLTDMFILSRYNSSIIQNTGIDFIEPGNTLGLTPINSGNKWLGVSPTAIQTNGDFDKGVNIIGLKIGTGRIIVYPGKYTNILETQIITGQGNHPIYLNIGNPPPYGNEGIASPVITNTYFSQNVLSAQFQLNGSQLIQVNADFVVEFYKSNFGNDMLDFLGREMITSLTGTTYTSNITIPSGVSLATGDRIAVTVTALGNQINPANPIGTSEASYTTVQGPCCAITSSNLTQMITGVSCTSINAAVGGPSSTTGNLSLIGTTCIGTSVGFNFSSLTCAAGTQFSVDYGDGYTVSNVTNSSHAYTTAGTYTAVVTTSSNPSGTCTQTINFVITVLADCCLPQESFSINALSDPSLGDVKKLCAGSPVTFNFIGTGNCVVDEALENVQWTFSNGTSGLGEIAQQTFITAGTYTVTAVFTVPGCTTYTVSQSFIVEDCGEIIPCTSCIGSFAPEPGEYIASVWVRELFPADPNLFASAEMKLSFIGDPTMTSIVANANTKVIDGWQRLEGKITVPAGATQLKIQLVNNSANTNNKVYFDDIRIHPFDASMKTYVYDPVTLRLVAELDERNYATLYEYDEEGILIRVKKETEKGIMTIKETRQNNSK